MNFSMRSLGDKYSWHGLERLLNLGFSVAVKSLQIAD